MIEFQQQLLKEDTQTDEDEPELKVDESGELRLKQNDFIRKKMKMEEKPDLNTKVNGSLYEKSSYEETFIFDCLREMEKSLKTYQEPEEI